MRVAIFGGTGFVGSYIVDALVAEGMQPALLVRPGNEDKVQHPDHCATISGDIADQTAIDRTLDGADVVIYNIGILRESPSKGITFEELHNLAARRIMESAGRVGVERFLLMSANGVKQDGTAYQGTKYEAERYLTTTELAWTIFRPSVIFGDPRGRSEFATQLLHEVIKLPLPAPLFYPGLLPFGAGAFELSPVHVLDVAKAFVGSLGRTETIGKIIHLGGPQTLSWREILRLIAKAAGRKKWMLPVPALSVSMAAALLERFDDFPVTRDQLRMLLEGNTCDSVELRELGIEPTAFDEGGLDYLRHTE